ncbi:MAG: HAMP domain-containing histidine kinase [Clostridia bacterium]|nr:HAMP domain-containing histidine kinase [Clostridia bacterium]
MTKRTLRSRMVFSLLALIGIAFAAVMVAFNISVQQYIDANAKQEIETARAFMAGESILAEETRPQQEQRFAQGFRNHPPNPIGAEVEFFVWDGETAYTGRDADPETAADLAERVNLWAPADEIQTVRTADGAFLTCVVNLDVQDEWLILYVDITPMENFASNINLQLLIIMVAVGAAAVAVAWALASSVSKPIEQIAAFAEKIGGSDFSPSPLTFRDRELSDLLRVMNATAAQLEAYDSDQKTFFQNVSHELKTPLMTIRCNAEGIAFHVMEPGESAETIMSETDRLGGMIDDILYVSRMDTITESEVLEECDLREVLSNCAESQRAAADKRGLSFVYDFSPEPVVKAVSEKSIQRAFSNLISNAIRYAADEIVLTCQEKDGKAVIDVWNDGPAIAPEALPHVFERFFKGADGQSGIGLSIVKSVVEKLGGSVRVSSGDGGTGFTIEIP